MGKAGKILSIHPPNAIPGGEVLIKCEGLEIEDYNSFGCYFDGVKARTVGASSDRILAIVPKDLHRQIVDVHLESNGAKSESFKMMIGKKLVDGLHLVANPAVDPKDDSIVLTRSGTRGQQLPITLLRLEKDDYLDEMPADVLNPTGVVFDKNGKLLVTNRANGEVYQINYGEEVVTVASNLGVATGIAFDKSGIMYVGDREGTIFRISEQGEAETWALLEPSVSAYHIAFGADENLYVAAPGLCSYDAVLQIDEEGIDIIFYKGLGRPQGLAFDKEGNLYVAACLKGRHGIVKISPDGEDAEMFVAGQRVVGLCFTRQGEMIVATNDSIYNLPLEIYGILLD